MGKDVLRIRLCRLLRSQGCRMDFRAYFSASQPMDLGKVGRLDKELHEQAKRDAERLIQEAREDLKRIKLRVRTEPSKMDRFFNKLFSPRGLILLGCIGVLCLALSMLFKAKNSNEWRSTKNVAVLKQTVNFETDCPKDQIEITEHFDDLKAVRVEACGKKYKYRFIGGDFEKTKWKRVKSTN